MSDYNPEAAFKYMRECEDAYNAAKTERQKAETIFGMAENAAQKKLADAWAAIEAMMAESGEYEIELPQHNARICWSTPRQSVKIVNPDAVPDEYCKIERKPELQKISDTLKLGAKYNWASLEYGEKHLMWKAVKSIKGEKNGH